MPDPCERCGRPVEDGGVCLSCAGRELESAYLGQDPATLPGEVGRGQPPVVPGWEVLRLLGAGGMGQLWLGRRSGGGESDLGVLKLVVPGMGCDAEDRFESEAEILASLDHPHILRVLDICTAADGRLAIVTEYVDGCDLRRLLRAEKLPAERAIDVFQKVCSAIAYAHGKGVIHRDLKPSNILVDSEGTVKVADFGLAKELRVSEAVRTSAGDGLGTPYYLAPELLRDAADADERADVYSLGVLLHEVLTGTVPMGTFVPISGRCGFQRGWDALVRRALMEDPGGRPEDARQLSVDAERLWERERRRGSWRGRLRLVAGGGVVLLAGVAGALLATRSPVVPPAMASFQDPGTATLETPWENSLGLQLVPLPGHGVLIGRTEVRNGDIRRFRDNDFSFLPEYRRDSGQVRRIGLPGWGDGGPLSDFDPDIFGGPEHPAFAVTEVEAHLFCAWLTMREREEGRIAPTSHYRLPTYAEWKHAAAAGGDLEKIDLRALGNFSGPEAEEGIWPLHRPIAEAADPFPRSAPVGSFPANAFGLYDLFGNVTEWVTRNSPDRERGAEPASARIGGAWTGLPSAALELDPSRGRRGPFVRCDSGLRVVLDLGQPAQ